MFKRRTPQKISTKIREAFWPSIGFKRAFQYLSLRIARMAKHDGGHALSKSIACGIAASFFPVMGLHALIAGFMAFCMRAPVVAGMLGTLLVPPFVLPVLFVFDFLVGRKILHTLGFTGWGTERHFTAEISNFDPTWFLDHLETLFFPAFIGFLFFLPLVWSASYMAASKFILFLHNRHRQKKAKLKQT